MEIINDKLYNWASDIDNGAILQAEKTARLPIVERVALMPDAHVGMGSTVGSVIGTNGAIIPAAVGVDIGCGMAAVEFDLTANDLPDSLEKFMPEVQRAIPAGVGEGHHEPRQKAYKWYEANKARFTSALDDKMVSTLLSQLGSLGSGNHFFEICLDERGKVWIVLHSGSRGLGNKTGMRHIKNAKALMELKRIGLESKDLSYFEETDDGFNLYIGDMLACQDYARANRDLMLDRALQAFRKFIEVPAKEVSRINCHHNFTQKEVIDGRELWVTRKGAIKADVGDMGIIPGSMGTRSYIVRGLGNSLSFNSCSHGAGRRFSRKEAKERFSEEDLIKSMEGKVWNSDKAYALVDEISGGYKDIDQVMADQADLVETVHTLSQVFNYKGQ